jgi:RHS repeat-associated protein
VRASGTAAQSQITIGYDDANRTVTTTSDQAAYNDNALKSQVLYDALGRTIESRQYEGGTNYIATQMQYDVMGRAYKTSNPFRPWQSETAVWTTSAFDALGRVVSVTTPDSAVVTSSYSGNIVTVTDQAGKQRQSVTDGLGRLATVYEDPSGLNYSTSYSYDTLDNLTTVSQGSQTRTFVYDSLKRLASATNPESGTISYQYDANGDLTSKTDARSITTTFAYDALNRAASRSYSDGTPAVSYYYDNAGLPSGAPSFTRGYATGRLVACIYGSGSAGTYRGYDEMGRVIRQYQQTESVNYLVEATYNLSGGMATETYPVVAGAGDRRTVSFSYDSAARLSSLSSSATSYAPAASVSSIGYGSQNALTTETYGNSLVHAVTYNTRLQPNEIKLGTSGAPTSVLDLLYNYGTTNSNGNVQSVTYAGAGLSYTQNFGYDALNRLTTSNENSGSSWSQTNVYDRYGNRQIDYGGGVYNLAFSTSTNRIATSGFSYDAAGNLTSDTIHAYTFDAENRISKVDNVSAYVYDGDGQRVKKLVGENTRFVYGIGGQLLAEFDGSTGNLKKEYIYGSSMITIEPTAVNSNGTQYLTGDNLGTPRVITNSSAGVVSRHDFMPFGEELGATVGGRTTGMGYSVTDGLRQKFTQKERDIETGLDFFEARHYSSTQGRFTSADDFLNDTHPTDPAGWNLYAYVRNNPLRYVDPTGEKIYVGDITNTADRDELLRRANYTYGCKDCVSVDKDGFLSVNTTGLSNDVLKATAYLTDAITSNDPAKLFSVQVTNNNSQVAFGDSQAGGAGVRLPGNNFKTSAIRIRLDFGDDKWVSGDKQAKEAFLNLVFAHEVAHFVPNYVHDPDDGRNTGPVVDAVNEIQQARGLLLRAQYGAFGRGSSGDFVSVEFGQAKTNRAGNIVRNRAGGIEVNRTNKTVTWIKRTVGGTGIN